MLIEHSTLTQFLIEERRRHPDASGNLNALILNIATACKAIAKRVGSGALGDFLEATSEDSDNEQDRNLDRVADRIFRRATEWSGQISGIVSQNVDTPFSIPEAYPKGKYLLLVDPLDGASNIDVNVSVGSIFSILRAPKPATEPDVDDFLQPGSNQVCAGYAIYGPSTMLIITVGTGVHGFTLDPHLGEFILTHPSITIPRSTSEFAINASNSRFWEPAIKRYVEECLAGQDGPRGKDFNMRWIASLVAEAHRILMRGGVFMYPRETRSSTRTGWVRLLYEANPVAYLIEQAGGLASDGRRRLLDLSPADLHQRVSVIFGSANEVHVIERYHRDYNEHDFVSPLFGRRGLYRGN